MADDTFANRLRYWLQRTDFFMDPFALSEADQERKYLPGLFVDKQYLYDILGDVNRLKPSILFAQRGEGKTATREMVAYECEKLNLKDKALAIRYFDFSYLLDIAEHDAGKITTKHHAQAIVRACLNVLVENVPAPYFEQIKDEDRKLFVSYVKQFADPISSITLIKLLGNESLDIPLLSMSAVETLNSLTKLLVKLGSSQESHYDAIYILVDRVDETELGPNAAIDILKPLISDKPLLEAPRIAFKFFLPREIEEKLKQAVELRTDRIIPHYITWDQESLKKMIDQRIYYYSSGHQTRLEDLCDFRIRHKVSTQLIKVCENSPRKLIQLCDRLVHVHVRRTQETLLTNEDLQEVIGETIQQKDIEIAHQSGVNERPANESDEVFPANGLYLNEGGHVWIDGKPVDPPLTDLEFQLLLTLYKRSPNIVETAKMIETIWPGGGGDDQNLRKLIGRLRKRLEPSGITAEARYIRNSKGRGYWLNLNR
jgi:DNA-binding winged helix-turn-helix (wHTH) protein